MTENKEKSKELISKRKIIEDFEDVFNHLERISNRIRELMKEGIDPVALLVEVVDDLDFVKLLCTVPLCQVSSKYYEDFEEAEEEDIDDEDEIEEADDEGEEREEKPEFFYIALRNISGAENEAREALQVYVKD